MSMPLQDRASILIALSEDSQLEALVAMDPLERADTLLAMPKQDMARALLRMSPQDLEETLSLMSPEDRAMSERLMALVTQSENPKSSEELAVSLSSGRAGDTLIISSGSPNADAKKKKVAEARAAADAALSAALAAEKEAEEEERRQLEEEARQREEEVALAKALASKKGTKGDDNPGHSTKVLGLIFKDSFKKMKEDGRSGASEERSDEDSGGIVWKEGRLEHFHKKPKKLTKQQHAHNILKAKKQKNPRPNTLNI